MKTKGRPGVWDPCYIHLDKKISVAHANYFHAIVPLTLIGLLGIDVGSPCTLNIEGKYCT